mgnify:CR=1 FL=1
MTKMVIVYVMNSKLMDVKILLHTITILLPQIQIHVII